jgi:fructose-1-phosphate kinase PfkB-like protein
MWENEILLISRSTIGAGDTFIAGMLYGLTCHSRDWTLSRELGFAIELAGRKVLQEGFSGLGDLMVHELNVTKYEGEPGLEVSKQPSIIHPDLLKMD